MSYLRYGAEYVQAATVAQTTPGLSQLLLPLDTRFAFLELALHQWLNSPDYFVGAGISDVGLIPVESSFLAPTMIE